VRKADNLPPYCAVVTESGSLNFSEPSGPLQNCYGTVLPFTNKESTLACRNLINVMCCSVTQLANNGRIAHCQRSVNIIIIIVIIRIQPLGRSGQRPEFNQATGMALVRCILGKFLGVVCHCFPPLFRCSHFSPPGASTSVTT